MDEQEVGQVTEQVTRKATVESRLNHGVAEDINSKESSSGSAIRDEAERQIESVTNGGKPLPSAVRSFFEPRFGRDFGDVRIHTGTKADEAAQSINAKAFTIGQNIVFQKGEYAPHTNRGKRLLAHELTHVVQQNGTTSRERIQRQREARSSSLLTDTQVESAIKWNDTRFATYGYEYIEFLQRLLESGDSWNTYKEREDFVRRVAEFQKKNKLKVDGKVGPNTLRKLWNQYLILEMTRGIRVIILAYDMPLEGIDLDNINYDGDYDKAGLAYKEDGEIKVRFGAPTFHSTYEKLANTIRHELQHVQQYQKGMTPGPLMEFNAEAQELLDEIEAAPEVPQSVHQQLAADAERALKNWKKLSYIQKTKNRDLFLRLRKKVFKIYRGLEDDPRQSLYKEIVADYYLAQVPPPF